MTALVRLSPHHFGLLFLPALLLGLWAEWQDFFSLWRDSIVYTHGYLVLAGVLFLLYQRRQALGRLSIQGSPLALLLLAGASVTLLVAQAADVRVVRLLLAPVVIVLWGWSIWGRDFLKTAAGPILLLLFAVPIWDDFSPVLQHITVFFNTLFLKVADIEATINEFLIVLEVGAFLVEDGCSGVRYLMVALFLGAFYGQLYYRDFRSKALLVVAAGLLSMLANWVRVFGVIAAGHYTNMETSLVRDHELFGWVVFVLLTLIPLFFLASRLEASAERPDSAGNNTRPETPAVQRSWLLWPALATALVVWPSLLAVAMEDKTEQIAQAWNPQLTDAAEGWRGPLKHASVWQPDYANADFSLGGVYVSDQRQQVQLQITGYRNQRQNKELVYYGNRLFHEARWRLVTSQKRSLPEGPALSPETVNETIIESPQDHSRVVVWSWYEVGGHLTDSRIEAKLVGALKKISGDSRGALWALAGRCDGGQDDACGLQRNAFQAFLKSLSP